MAVTRKAIAGFIGAVLLALALVVASALLTPDSTRYVPADGTVVVARLTTGQTLSADLRAALHAQRNAPNDAPLALTAAKALIDEGRRVGDSRLVGAALPVLQPFMDRPQAMFLAATARQYQHDFPGALALLDRVLTQDPRDVNALLNRATIHTVVGEYDLALQDCARITALPRPDVGFFCAASAQTLTRAAPDYAARLTQMVAQPGLVDLALLPWARSLLGEMAMLQGNLALAEAQLAQVVKEDPDAQRDMLMLADILLAQGRKDAVLSLLRPAPDTDGVLIRRILAGDADAQDIRQTLAARAQRSLDLGLVAHAREEALYFLHVANDPARALERALANWAQQHEFDDAMLLVAAAKAAGQPAAAQPLQDWIAAHDINIPALADTAGMKPDNP